jgi:hypothetical protein
MIFSSLFSRLIHMDSDAQMLDAEPTPMFSSGKGKAKAVTNGHGPAYEDDNLPW